MCPFGISEGLLSSSKINLNSLLEAAQVWIFLLFISALGTCKQFIYLLRKNILQALSNKYIHYTVHIFQNLDLFQDVLIF